MPEEVYCKDNAKKKHGQVPVGLPGWEGMRCVNASLFEERYEFTLRPTRHTAKCPCCGKRSGHVHSLYTRTVRDLPIQGRGSPKSMHGN